MKLKNSKSIQFQNPSNFNSTTSSRFTIIQEKADIYKIGYQVKYHDLHNKMVYVGTYWSINNINHLVYMSFVNAKIPIAYVLLRKGCK